MNYGTAENTINIFRETNPSALSKGLVISLNSFAGRIEVSNSVFNKNMVFFPSAAFSNAPKFNQTVFDPIVNTFIKWGGENALDKRYLRMSVESSELNHTIQFWNYLKYYDD